jgi:hypothetical protein
VDDKALLCNDSLHTCQQWRRSCFLCGQCSGYNMSMKPAPHNKVTAEKSASLVRASMKTETRSEVND